MTATLLRPRKRLYQIPADRQKNNLIMTMMVYPVSEDQPPLDGANTEDSPPMGLKETPEPLEESDGWTLPPNTQPTIGTNLWSKETLLSSYLTIGNDPLKYVL